MNADPTALFFINCCVKKLIKMKQLWIFACLILLIACENNKVQNNKSKLKDLQESPPITAAASSNAITDNNYYDQMVKAVKHYPKELCTWSMLIMNNAIMKY